MTRSYIIPMLATLTCLACASSSRAESPASSASPSAGADFRWQKKIEAPVQFELHNINGGLEAEAATDDTLSIVAVKTGKREDFARVRIVVREDGGTVVACALWPGQSTCARDQKVTGGNGKVDVRVDFVVRLPAKVAQLEAETMNGSLTAANLAGRARLRTMNGHVNVVAAGSVDAQTMNGSVVAQVTASGAPVHLASKSGRVELTLPASANADVEASTLHGTISSAFGAVPPPPFPGMPNKAQFRVGAGGVRIALETLNGDVILRRGT